jgi:hypothetical protein
MIFYFFKKIHYKTEAVTFLKTNLLLLIEMPIYKHYCQRVFSIDKFISLI